MTQVKILGCVDRGVEGSPQQTLLALFSFVVASRPLRKPSDSKVSELIRAGSQRSALAETFPGSWPRRSAATEGLAAVGGNLLNLREKAVLDGPCPGAPNVQSPGSLGEAFSACCCFNNAKRMCVSIIGKPQDCVLLPYQVSFLCSVSSGLALALPAVTVLVLEPRPAPSQATTDEQSETPRKRESFYWKQCTRCCGLLGILAFCAKAVRSFCTDATVWSVGFRTWSP